MSGLKSQKTRTRQRFYLVLLLGLSFLGFGGMFGFNVLSDPFWHFGGNKIVPRNFPFNERISKLTFIQDRAQNYDCLILGSSRVTLLDPQRIKGYTCFNLAIAAGRAPEALALARYVKPRMPDLKLVIVGVAEANFWTDTFKPVIPDFVTRNEAPPSFWSQYSTMSTTLFSVRTLLVLKPSKRYYDKQLSCHTTPGLGSFDPVKDKTARLLDIDYDPGRAESWYQPIKSLFPDQRVIGYAPPRTAWFSTRMWLNGTLENYLDGIKRVASHYGEFYEFSIPGGDNNDPTKTHNGSHFYGETNAKVADHMNELINGADPGVEPFGYPVHLHSVDELRAVYERQIKAFAAQNDVSMMATDFCATGAACPQLP